MKIVVSVADQRAKGPDDKEQKIDVYDAKPFDYAPLIKKGNKLETQFPQTLRPVVLERCLN